MSDFRLIEADDIQYIAPFFLLRDNWTCDSTFFDSFLWRELYQIRYRIDEGEAVQWLMHEEDETALEVSTALPLCRPERLQYFFDKQQQYFNQVLGRKMKVYLADEEALAWLHLPEGQYRVWEETDLGDYLYDAKALRELSGRDFHKKKNHVNGFLRDYQGRFVYRPLDHTNAAEIWDFLMKWEEHKDGESHLAAEAQGICQALPHIESLQAKMAGVYVDGRLEAFTIGSYNERMKMSIVHIEKANPEIRGLYAYINQQFQIQAFPEAEVVNREDDMGLPGLRKAKESYHPIRMARKFNIEQL